MNSAIFGSRKMIKRWALEAWKKLYGAVRKKIEKEKAAETFAFFKTLSWRIYPSDQVATYSTDEMGHTSLKVTLHDARQIVETIKRACEQRIEAKIEIGRLGCNVDGRVGKYLKNRITFEFYGLGSSAFWIKRDDVIQAIDRFTQRFGQHQVTTIRW